LRDIDANDTNNSTMGSGGDYTVGDIVLLRFELLVDALVAEAVTTSVGTIGVQLEDLLRGVAFGKVDWDSSNFLGFGEADGT
jgi:hypothetical protein